MPETAPNASPEISDITAISERKYLQTTIGDLRKLYGANFAKGCEDTVQITDVVRKQPSLMRVMPHRERTKIFRSDNNDVFAKT
jgi:hypothetical protein